MRGVLLVAVLTLSCSGTDSASETVTPSAASVVYVSPTPTPAVVTIGQDLARCPTAAELASVDSLLSLTFTSDPSAGSFVCTAAEGSRDLTLLKERAYQAVLLLTWIRFNKELPWTKLTLDAWLAHAIHGIDFRGDYQYSYCCAPGGVVVIQAKNLSVLSPEAPPFEAVEGLAALFIHEARHNEGYLHTCATGERAGLNDATIAELGAWGVQYYFLLWVGTHSDPAVVPEPLRFASRSEADSMPLRFFCPPTAPAPS